MVKSTAKGYLAITCQAIIIGLSYMFVKIALNSANPIDLLADRFTIAAVAVFIFRLVKPHSFPVKINDLAKLVPLSLAYPILFFLFQTLGLKLVSSSEAGIIYAMIPIITLFVAKFVLGESISSLQAALMFVSIAGVVFINLMNGLSVGNYVFWGILFILLSTLSSALYNVFTRKLSVKYSTLTITYVMTMVGFVIFNLIAVIQHAILGTMKIQYFLEPFSSMSFTLSILYLGILSSLLTSLLSTYALGKLEASTVGQFNNFSTVISILAGVIFLNESLYYYHYLGIAAILIGTFGFNYLKNRNV